MHLDQQVREVLQMLQAEGAFPSTDAFAAFARIEEVAPLTEEEQEVVLSAEVLSREQQAMIAEGIDASDLLVEQFCSLLEKGLSRASACKALEIDYRRFVNAQRLWKQGAPEKPGPTAPMKETIRWAARQRHWDRLDIFFNALAQEEARLEVRLLDPQVKAATDPKAPDLKVGQWLLERRFSRNWGKVSNVRHEGKPEADKPRISVVQNIIATANLSDAELEAMERAHAIAGAAKRLTR